MIDSLKGVSASPSMPNESLAQVTAAAEILLEAAAAAIVGFGLALSGVVIVQPPQPDSGYHLERHDATFVEPLSLTAAAFAVALKAFLEATRRREKDGD